MLRVLDFVTHPPLQFDLAKTGHEFRLVSSECWPYWDEQLRPFPRT